MKKLDLLEMNNAELLKALQNLLPKGKTQISNSNLFYLNIDDAYIHQLFPFIKDDDIKKPAYFSEKMSGAHVTIAYPEEYNEIDEEDLFQEHDFLIKRFVTAEIAQKKYYVLLVESSSLLQLRKKYSLPNLLSFKGYSIGFHITIAVKSL
jgi:hypothetical protein